MKKQLAYILTCACLFWACENEIASNKSPCTFKQDKNKQIINTPPFNKATKIEAISFDLKKFCKDLEAQKKSIIEAETPVKIENGVLFVPHIIKRYTLTATQTQSLFETLVFNHGDDLRPAKCYNPHDVLVFYEGDKPFAFLEICFQCNAWRSYQTDFKDFCSEKWQKLATFFPTPKKEN